MCVLPFQVRFDDSGQSGQVHWFGQKFHAADIGLASFGLPYRHQSVDSEHRKAICALDRLLFPNVPKFDESRNSGETVN